MWTEDQIKTQRVELQKQLDQARAQAAFIEGILAALDMVLVPKPEAAPKPAAAETPETPMK